MGLQSMDAIAQPALLLYESNSVFLDCQKELGQRLPNVSSVVLPGARLKHFSSLEHPDLVAANVRSFLKEYQESALNPTPAR
jgi:pimeloyl-ACP methyl ester carboxylesterase